MPQNDNDEEISKKTNKGRCLVCLAVPQFSHISRRPVEIRIRREERSAVEQYHHHHTISPCYIGVVLNFGFLLYFFELKCIFFFYKSNSNRDVGPRGCYWDETLELYLATAILSSIWHQLF